MTRSTRSLARAPHRVDRPARLPRPKRLSDLANVGPATLADFELLGIRTVAQLSRRSPMALYRSLCRRTACRQDPCVIDVFMATVAQARGGVPRPWWHFTPARKRLLTNPSRKTRR